jgi:uncharacterized protein YneF (UPF0154 family)
MSKYPIAWSGVVPIAMSLTLLLLIWVGGGVLGVNPLPIHDEDAVDHIGMLLVYGQVPVIAYFVLDNRRETGRMLAMLGVQLALLAMILGGVYRVEYINKKQVALRIEKNAPLPGSEMALRRYIESQRQGHPDYDSMSSGVARYVVKSPAMTQTELRLLGPLQSLAFKGVDRIGWDIYNARFTGEDREWRIFIASNGKIFGLTVSNGKSGCQSSEPYECR